MRIPEPPEGARIQEWRERLRSRLGSVLTSLPGAPSYQVPECPTPQWLLLPVWLDEAWGCERTRSCGEELTDLLWGQYALFLSIRLQDDLLDRHRDDLRLLFVADRFLLESLETFQRASALSEMFWALYRGCVRETVDGILEVWRLEGEPGQFTVDHLDLHARVSAIFKLATAAVCHLHGRSGELRWLSDFQDRLAVFSQICDDLQDLAADLKDGRFTWVANTLLAVRASEAIATEERSHRLAEGLMQPDRSDAVLEELWRLARDAASAVPKSAPGPVHDLVNRLQSKVSTLEHSMHEARVRWVFGEALAEAKRSARAIGAPMRTVGTHVSVAARDRGLVLP